MVEKNAVDFALLLQLLIFLQVSQVRSQSNIQVHFVSLFPWPSVLRLNEATSPDKTPNGSYVSLRNHR